MKIFIKSLIIYLLCFNVNADQYNYLHISDVSFDAKDKSYSNYQNMISIDESNNNVYSGHVFTKYSGCTEEQWVCIFGETLNFAIPKNKIKDQNSWKYNDFNFVVSDSPSSFVEMDKIYKIGVFEKNNKTNFMIVFYSEKRGVIGFSILFGNDTETYWLVGEKGFGVS